MKPIDEILAMPAAALTSHRPPVLLVTGPRSLEDGGGTVAVTTGHDGLDALQLIEVAAQGLAVLMGCEIHLRPGDDEPAIGMLVGARDLVVSRGARPGETLQVRSRRTCTVGPMELHDVVVVGAGDEPLLVGELKIFSTQVIPEGA